VDETVTNMLKLLDGSPLSGQSIEEIATGLRVSRLEAGAAVKVACEEGLLQAHEDVGFKRWQLTDKGVRQQRDTEEPSS
jgi:hypothetical protein